MNRTVEAPQATTVLCLPLAKRKTTASTEMEAVKKFEPTHVSLCERGADLCAVQGIKSAHIKRTSNAPYVAVTLKHPKTGKRVSVALWKIVTGRWESGWSVRYINRSICDLRLENLETAEPEPDEPETAEPEPNLKHAPMIADPFVIELQKGLVETNAEDFQIYLKKTAYKVLRKGITRNLRELSEDLVSAMLPGLWKQIVNGNVKHQSYKGLRGWAARCVALQAGKLAKLGEHGHWGHSIPEKPERAAKFDIALMEYDAAFTDAAKAEADGELKPRPTSAAKDSDSQWSDTFQKLTDRAVAAARRRAGIALDVKADPTPRKKKKKRKKSFSALSLDGSSALVT